MYERTVTTQPDVGQCLTDAEVQGFADGELHPNAMRGVHEHCNGCPDCSRRVADLINGRRAA